MSRVEEAVRALVAGRAVVLPTDTVYGLACSADSEEPTRALYRLKGRTETQPTALVAASVDVLLERLPELAGPAEEIVRALLPGAFTLVLPNPTGRFPWLAGARKDAIGVRVPALAGEAAAVLARVGAVVATSANLPGGAEPRRLQDVPPALAAGVACALDGGELPGVPSTVIDFTPREPAVLRHGAGDAATALARVAAVLGKRRDGWLGAAVE